MTRRVIDYLGEGGFRDVGLKGGPPLLICFAVTLVSRGTFTSEFPTIRSPIPSLLLKAPLFVT